MMGWTVDCHLKIFNKVHLHKKREPKCYPRMLQPGLGDPSLQGSQLVIMKSLSCRPQISLSAVCALVLELDRMSKLQTFRPRVSVRYALGLCIVIAPWMITKMIRYPKVKRLKAQYQVKKDLQKSIQPLDSKIKKNGWSKWWPKINPRFLEYRRVLLGLNRRNWMKISILL